VFAVFDGDERRMAAELSLVLWSDKDCPVCGFGNAFAAACVYDVCARCGWVDDPTAYGRPDEVSDTNDNSFNETKRRWPVMLLNRLATAALSSFEVVVRADRTGGYDYVVDGASVRDTFDTSPWDLTASNGPRVLPGNSSALPFSGMTGTPAGRRRLYVCSLCGGDDYEASLTADVHVIEDRVIWSRIGIETYQYELGVWTVNLRRGPAGFAFDARLYRG
jgi:hypothetical protein